LSGTKEGAAKSVAVIKSKYGEDYFKNIGKIGGTRGRTGGFYGNSERARAAGAKGGAISKRGPNKPKTAPELPKQSIIDRVRGVLHHG